MSEKTIDGVLGIGDRRRGHIHAEAFMLMQYSCDACPHTETIWNSRDGVTPFGCECPSCGATLLHKNWRADVYAPDHKPRPWQRIWRDGTPEEAVAFITERIEKFRGKYPITPEAEAKLIQQARDGSGEAGEFRKGWPNIDIGKNFKVAEPANHSAEQAR